ncbi:MAG: hypothetical protein ACUVT9_06880 [Candidatus Bathycorpusculaceae bacterium]
MKRFIVAYARVKAAREVRLMLQKAMRSAFSISIIHGLRRINATIHVNLEINPLVTMTKTISQSTTCVIAQEYASNIKPSSIITQKATPSALFQKTLLSILNSKPQRIDNLLFC